MVLCLLVVVLLLLLWTQAGCTSSIPFAGFRLVPSVHIHESREKRSEETKNSIEIYSYGTKRCQRIGQYLVDLLRAAPVKITPFTSSPLWRLNFGTFGRRLGSAAWTIRLFHWFSLLTHSRLLPPRMASYLVLLCFPYHASLIRVHQCLDCCAVGGR